VSFVTWSAISFIALIQQKTWSCVTLDHSQEFVGSNPKLRSVLPDGRWKMEDGDQASESIATNRLEVNKDHVTPTIIDQETAKLMS